MKTEYFRTVDDDGRVVLPYEIRNALEWSEGTRVLFVREGDKLVMQCIIN